jgi:glycopeptide antibiotics resistance protein
MRIFSKILFLLYIAALLFLSLASFAGIDLGIERTDILGIPIDKCIHFLMFLPYPILAYFASPRKNYWRTLFYVGMTGFIIAFLLELSQGLLTADRVTDIWDLVANVIAILIGTAVLLLFKRK